MSLKNIEFKNEFIRFLKYCFVGVLNTAVDYLSFFVLSQFFSVNIYLSQALAFMIATFNSYLFNSRFTFKVSDTLFSKKLFHFYILNIFTMLISIISLYIFCDILKINELVAKIPIIPITFLINYFGNRLVIFKNAK